MIRAVRRAAAMIAASGPSVIELQFVSTDAQRPALDRAWIDQLLATANGVDGLRVIPEPGTDATGSTK